MKNKSFKAFKLNFLLACFFAILNPDIQICEQQASVTVCVYFIASSYCLLIKLANLCAYQKILLRLQKKWP